MPSQYGSEPLSTRTTIRWALYMPCDQHALGQHSSGQRASGGIRESTTARGSWIPLHRWVPVLLVIAAIQISAGLNYTPVPHSWDRRHSGAEHHH